MDVGRLLALRPVDDVEQSLHLFPSTLQNFINIYQPTQQGITGALTMQNFANQISFLCGGIQAASRLNSEQAAKLCVQYLAPIIKNRQYNFPPIGQNLFVGAQHGLRAVPRTPVRIGCWVGDRRERMNWLHASLRTIYDWMGVCKAGLESVNRYLARDLGVHKIRVNCVNPVFSPDTSLSAEFAGGTVECSTTVAPLARAGTKASSGAGVVGGMSRVPGVARFLGPHFPKAAIHHDLGVPADEVVVAGEGDSGEG